MNLVLTPSLELKPASIGGRQLVTVRYSVGALNVTRACDQILVGGVARPERECFPVTGTLTSRQIETRHIDVDPPAGDFVEVKVLVREVDTNNAPIPGEVELPASGKLAIL